MNERLREVRSALSLTMDAFARELNVSRPTISLIEKGERNLTNRMVSDICRIWNVNETWLRTGDGEMFAPATREQEIAQIVAGIIQDDESLKSKLIEAIASLNESQIKAAHDIILQMAESIKKSHHSDGSV